jgi:endonuclease YncB( thermonuclease family)
MKRCVLFCIFALVTAFADVRVLTGEVVALSDGDTITVLDSSNVQHKVRLAGIDAPESKQAFGTVSRQHLAALVFRKQVTVEWFKRDRYGRIVGKV